MQFTQNKLSKIVLRIILIRVTIVNILKHITTYIMRMLFLVLIRQFLFSLLLVYGYLLVKYVSASTLRHLAKFQIYHFSNLTRVTMQNVKQAKIYNTIVINCLFFFSLILCGYVTYWGRHFLLRFRKILSV